MIGMQVCKIIIRVHYTQKSEIHILHFQMFY